MITATTTYDWARATAVFGLDEPGHTIIPTTLPYDFTINRADMHELRRETMSALYGKHGLRN